MIRRSGDSNPVMERKRGLITSVITEFFSPMPKRIRMERCDGNSWSDEEWFLGATQKYVDDTSSPEGAEDGGVEQVSHEEEGVMEEFVIDDSFEEWTATFLGRASLGCGEKQVEEAVESGAGSRTDDKVGEFGAKKDDLGETLEILDRTVFLIPDADEDPSHPRVTVTEPNKRDFSGGVAWVRKIQE